jgi:hypothetical protein
LKSKAKKNSSNFTNNCFYISCSEHQRLIDVLDTTDQATKLYNVDKHELDLKLKKNADFEAAALDLMNFMFKTVSER